MFTLDSRLQNDTFHIADLKISQLLLMNDANYPWLILVPKKAGLTELTDLSFDEQTVLLREINLVAQVLQKNFPCDKINIAALGNVVSQLHIHVIARQKTDATFPKPVWGNAPAKKYSSEEVKMLIEKIKLLVDS